MPFRVLAESMVQLHHKIDAIMRKFNVEAKPVHFIGEVCPVCSRQIEYVIDPSVNVVVRKCSCSTNKVPSIIQLTTIGDSNASKSTRSDKAAEESYWSQDSGPDPRKLRK